MSSFSTAGNATPITRRRISCAVYGPGERAKRRACSKTLHFLSTAGNAAPVQKRRISCGIRDRRPRETPRFLKDAAILHKRIRRVHVQVSTAGNAAPILLQDALAFLPRETPQLLKRAAFPAANGVGGSMSSLDFYRGFATPIKRRRISCGVQGRRPRETPRPLHKTKRRHIYCGEWGRSLHVQLCYRGKCRAY